MALVWLDAGGSPPLVARARRRDRGGRRRDAYAAVSRALWYAAQRFFVASRIAFKPAFDIFRFVGFAGPAGCACCFFCAAHLARCAAAILARPAALIVLRFFGVA